MTRVIVLEGLIVKLFKEGSKIYMSLRTKSRERVWILIDDFRPYFYIPSKLGEYKSVFGETLDIVYADDPSKIPDLRSRYNKHYEADIPYLRRFLIDTGLKQCVRIESLKNTVSYRELKPVECNIEPRVWFLDIEVYNILDDGSNVLPTPENPTLPVIAISIYDTYNKKFVTWIWHSKLATKEFTTKYSPRSGEEYVVEVRTFKSEELMLEDFKDYHALILPDIIAGWNISFDMRYLNARTKALGIYNNFYASDTLDLLEAYKRMGIKRRSYALKNVTVEEGIETRSEAVEARDVIYQWKENPIPIVKYNLRDVWRILKIDEKYNIIKYFLEIKHIAGIESIEKAFSSLVIVDTLILREAKRKGIVLPSSEEHPDYGKFKGAYVLNPPKGIIEGVAVFDMSRYYPSLIISFNISPEKLLRCKGDVCLFKQDEPGLIPLAVENMLKMREELESELAKYDPSSPEYKRLEDKIMAVKGVVNSFYGVLGSPHFRLYDVRVAQTITALGREGLLYASRVAESMGYKAIYGDSVSPDSKIIIFNVRGNPIMLTVEELWNRYSRYSYRRTDGKEEIYVKPMHLLTYAVDMSGNMGLKEIVRIIRHKVNKRWYRICSDTGKCIRVTEDHSVIVYDVNDNKLKLKRPSDICIDTDRLVTLDESLFDLRKEYKDDSVSYKEVSQYDYGRLQETCREKKERARKILQGNEIDKRNSYSEIEGRQVPHLFYTSKAFASTYTSTPPEYKVLGIRNIFQFVQRRYKECFESICFKCLEQGVEKRRYDKKVREREIRVMAKEEVKKYKGMDGSNERYFIVYDWYKYNTKIVRAKNLYFREDTLQEPYESYETVWSESILSKTSSKSDTRFDSNVWKENIILNICRWMFLPLLPDMWLLSQIRGAEKKYRTRQESECVAKINTYKLCENMGTRYKKQLGASFSEFTRTNKISYEESEVLWIPIRLEKIIKLEEENMVLKDNIYAYDLEVEDYHTFFANGILVHNTDSLFIKVPFDKAEELSKILSDEVKKYFKRKYNLSREPIIKMKFEKYYRRILFSGAKKRYIGWLVWKKGKETDQIDITGFEGIRSDYPVFTTYAEEKIAEFLLKTDRIDINKIYEEIAKLYEEFKKRPLDEIALSKGLSKELHEYTSKSPHVRAAIYSNIYLGTNFKKGDKVRYVWVKYVRGLPATDVVAFEDSKQIEDRVVVDYDRQFRVVVVDPLNNIFEGLGIKIKSIRPKKTFW